MNEHFDILIIGAGLSGIGIACQLADSVPEKRVAILERRDRSGGTWDLFRYPGIRSDSDMYTLGYSFKPWRNAKAIADGPSILEYVRDTARENGIESKIRYQHRVVRAQWSSVESRWTVDIERGPDKAPVRMSCNFLYMCSGYYNYAGGYSPSFPGAEQFKGRIVHPQKWTPDIDYAGKKVVVIGSGATAVTLVPSMADKAAHVTMLQRSPTYIASLPARDAIANGLRAVLPSKVAYFLTRWKNVLFGMVTFWLSRERPELMKKIIRKRLREALGPDFDIRKHFTPSYNPWDQRFCLVPDGDLFKALREKRASIVTDHIETFTENGIQLKSGEHLAADLIVTATGLELQLFGGMQLAVDGKAIETGKTLNYKGVMLSDVPNFGVAVGYTNASWTLKCDLTCEYICRLINHMDKHGYTQCTPRQREGAMDTVPFIDFSSGYVQRAIAMLPKQGAHAPWKLYQNYALDILTLRHGKLADETLEFSGPQAAGAVRQAA